jgi:hypothetical protein
MLQPKTSIPLSAEDREYLQHKGAFNLPRSDTCDTLLRAYFHHVHPICPVVDATTVLKSYPCGESNQCNLLLLWSMFFVAANVRQNTFSICCLWLRLAPVYLCRHLEAGGLFV